jgi:hypothetical protein
MRLKAMVALALGKPTAADHYGRQQKPEEYAAVCSRLTSGRTNRR